jgi:hypothetical protein
MTNGDQNDFTLSLNTKTQLYHGGHAELLRVHGDGDKFAVRPKPSILHAVSSNAVSAGRAQGSPNLRHARERFQLMLEEIIRSHHRPHACSPTPPNNSQSTARDAFIAALQSSCMSHARLDSFKSVPAIRNQLMAEFIHLHYAREGEDFFPSKMTLILSPETSSLTAATNALYLAQLATSASDQKLLRNAAVSYRCAVQSLQRDLSKPNACYDDNVFGTIHVLSLCEAFKGIAIHDTNQDQHSNGMALLFQARGPKSLHNVYMMIQLQQHHHGVLLKGLLSRRRPLTATGKWLEVDKNCYLRLTSLTTLVMRVPGALEDATELLTQGSKASLKDIMDTLTALRSLETRLQAWMTAWYGHIKVLPYWTVPSTTLPWLPASSTFASALQFSTPLVAKAHVLYWMPLLTLREMTLEVVELHPFPLFSATANSQSKALHNQIRECADSLCMTAMFLTNPANGIDGCMEACGPLVLASTWYEKIRDGEKFTWCQEMLDSIEIRGLRVPRFRCSVKQRNAKLVDPGTRGLSTSSPGFQLPNFT